MRSMEIADEMLDRIDADKVLDFIAVTTIFAWCRADTPHNGREGIGVGGAFKCVFCPAHFFIGKIA